MQGTVTSTSIPRPGRVLLCVGHSWACETHLVVPLLLFRSFPQRRANSPAGRARRCLSAFPSTARFFLPAPRAHACTPLGQGAVPADHCLAYGYQTRWSGLRLIQQESVLALLLRNGQRG